MFKLTKGVRIIIILNTVVFLLSILFIELIYNNYALYPLSSDNFNILQFISHQFVHFGFFHIAFNMIAIASLGTYVEEYFGFRKFVLIYIVCGIIGALIQMLFINDNTPMVGASGAVFGILAIFTLMNPNQKMYIFFIPYAIKIKWITITYLVIEILLGILTTSNVGHFAHIGGALAGLALYYLSIEINLSKRQKW